MADRPITFDLRDSSNLSMGFDSRRGTPNPDGGDPELERRFKEVLDSQQHTKDGQGPTSAAPLPSPFDLLGHPKSDTEDALTPQSEGSSAPIMDSLRGMVQQLMVGDGLDGRRTLRMDIDPELLPGVSVTILEDAGAWVAEFECRDERSFVQLARSASQMAQKLAEILQQDAVWRVFALELPVAGQWQSWVQAHLDRPGVEASATAYTLRGNR